jgi:hypothetical protein
MVLPNRILTGTELVSSVSNYFCLVRLFNFPDRSNTSALAKAYENVRWRMNRPAA